MSTKVTLLLISLSVLSELPCIAYDECGIKGELERCPRG